MKPASMAALQQGWPALSELLDDALALPPGERDAWLAGLAGRGVVSAQQQDTLRALLATQAGIETGDFLADLPPLPAVPPAHAGAVPGAIVGPYRLSTQIGQGGMASVWLAERTDGLIKRQVALKLPAAVWGEAFAARLARERQILASLTHAHIARLYDAGIDAQGRPFLAMEWIDGEPIDAFCKNRSAPLAQRIDLLLQVMAAVAHAHARLVVHRDLKPSNILVSADGKVSLLDFGIAKLLEGDLTQDTALTRAAGHALTPDYASPEQIRGEPLGTASDIYSLAVVFFEVVTGGRPYRLRRGNAAELEAAIASAEAPLASAVATDRALARHLRGDLDSILNKALKKRPEERYPTMDAFAQDLRRWRDGKPVQARPDGLGYRAAKFVSRYRLQVTAGGVVALALVGGTAVALWQAHEARLQAQRAQTEAATATAVQDFLQGIFRANSGDQDDPDKARSTTARELLDTGAERINAELRDAPEARLRLLGTLAEMYGSMAVLDRAAELHRQRVTLARATWGPDSAQLATALAGLAGALAVVDQRKEALASATEASALLDRLGDTGSRTRFEIDMALATVYERSDSVQGLAAARRATANARSRGASTDLVNALQMQSEIATQVGDAALSREGAQEAIKLVEADPRHGANNLSTLYVALADAQAKLGQLDAAEVSYRRSITLSDERNRVSPIFLHSAERQYGSFLRRSGKLRQSVDIHRPGYEWARANPGAFGVMVPTLIGEYGRALVTYGLIEEGLSVLDEALARQARLEDAPEVTNALLQFRAQGLLELGRLNAARADLQRAQAFFDRGAQGPNPSLAALSRQLLVAEGHADQALAEFQADRVEHKLPPFPDATASAKVLTESAWLELEAGHADTAQNQAKAALNRIATGPIADYQRDLEARATLVLGKALLRSQAAPQALPVLERAVELHCAVYDRDHSPAVAHAWQALADARRALGAPGAADARAQARRIEGKAKALSAPRPPMRTP
jgi:serine/threonine-protein kinase